jgi:hypothetical protein
VAAEAERRADEIRLLAESVTDPPELHAVRDEARRAVDAFRADDPSPPRRPKSRCSTARRRHARMNNLRLARDLVDGGAIPPDIASELAALFRHG